MRMAERRGVDRVQFLEHYQGRVLERILLPGQRIPDPSLLRTHPPTEERIRRLLDLRDKRLIRPELRLPADLPSNDPFADGEVLAADDGSTSAPGTLPRWVCPCWKDVSSPRPTARATPWC